MPQSPFESFVEAFTEFLAKPVRGEQLTHEDTARLTMYLGDLAGMVLRLQAFAREGIEVEQRSRVMGDEGQWFHDAYFAARDDLRPGDVPSE